MDAVKLKFACALDGGSPVMESLDSSGFRGWRLRLRLRPRAPAAGSGDSHVSSHLEPGKPFLGITANESGTTPSSLPGCFVPFPAPSG
jgi:hypothetical protein